MPNPLLHLGFEIPFDENGQSRGDTMFASAVDAYDALDAETKALIDGRNAVHFFGAKKRGVKKPVKVTQEQLDKNPPVSHPIARTHPVSGRKAIYVTADECTGIEGIQKQARGLSCCSWCPKAEKNAKSVLPASQPQPATLETRKPSGSR